MPGYDDACRPAVPDWQPPDPGIRIYFLDIRYPEGSREPGWRPACWSDPGFLESLSRRARRRLARQVFRWPRERMYLSSSGAYKRAWLLRWYGADVTVCRSLPVTWPEPEPAVWVIDLKQPGSEWPGCGYPEFDSSGIPR